MVLAMIFAPPPPHTQKNVIENWDDPAFHQDQFFCCLLNKYVYYECVALAGHLFHVINNTDVSPTVNKHFTVHASCQNRATLIINFIRSPGIQPLKNNSV